MRNISFAIWRTPCHRRHNDLGELLAPLLHEAVAELRKRHVPLRHCTAVREDNGQVSRRSGWWLNLGGATPHRHGIALWIDRDARQWDDATYEPFWRLQSTTRPARLPRWPLRSYGHRAGVGHAPTFAVAVDHRVDGGLVVTRLDSKDATERQPFRHLLDRGIADATLERCGRTA